MYLTLRSNVTVFCLIRGNRGGITCRTEFNLNTFMAKSASAGAKKLRVGMIGYRFMGKAHSNAWRQAPHFFPLKAGVEMHTVCGRDAKGVEAAREQLGWQNAST